MDHSPTQPHKRFPFGAPEWVVTLATLWAVFVRQFRLDVLPPAAWYDEIWYALRAREILWTGHIPVFYQTSFGGANAGPVYLTALAQAFGFDGITGGRRTVALLGALAVPLSYACLRELQRAYRVRVGDRRWVAALGAVVLAYTLSSVIIDRIGMENGVAVPTALFVVWQLLRGIHRQKWIGWLLVGLAAGAAQYNGLHARFILPLIGAIWLHDFIFAGGWAQRRRMLLGAALVAALGLVINLPLIGFFRAHPDLFAARGGIVTQVPADRFDTAWEMYRWNLDKIVKVFSIEGSYDPKFTIPGVPLLDPIQSAGFLVGLGWSVWNLPRNPLARLLPFWLILGVLPSLITEGAPNLGRMVGIWAPTVFLVALGWALIYRRMASRGSEPLRRTLPLIALVLVVNSAGYHTWLLFGRWPHSPRIDNAFTTAPVELARELAARAEDEAVFVEVIPEADEDIAAFEWYAPLSDMRRMDFRKCLPLAHERDSETTYLVISGRDLDSAGRLEEAYPGARVSEPLDLWQTTGTLLEIPAGALAPEPPQRAYARFEPGLELYGYEWSGGALRAGETLFITAYWRASATLPADLIAFAHLGNGVEQPLAAQRDDRPCLGLYPTDRWLPGDLVPDSFAIQVPSDTPPGTYDLALGWYRWPSLERLHLVEADLPLADDRAVIGQVEIHEP